jgi:hypothetical protein
MDKPTLPEITPTEIAKRPCYKQLSPAEERAFLREQAVYAAAYRRWGDPLAPWEAFCHIERSGQTVPGWLHVALFEVITRNMTPDVERRSRERWQFAKRYTLVRNYRATVDERTGRKISEDRAVDLAIIDLQAGADEARRDEAEHATIKNTYRKIRGDLKRRGRESEWFYYVDEEGEGTDYCPSS